MYAENALNLPKKNNDRTLQYSKNSQYLYNLKKSLYLFQKRRKNPRDLICEKPEI